MPNILLGVGNKPYVNSNGSRGEQHWWDYVFAGTAQYMWFLEAEGKAKSSISKVLCSEIRTICDQYKHAQGKGIPDTERQSLQGKLILLQRMFEIENVQEETHTRTQEVLSLPEKHMLAIKASDGDEASQLRQANHAQYQRLQAALSQEPSAAQEAILANYWDFLNKD